MRNTRAKIKKTEMEDTDHHSTTDSATVIGSNEDLLTEILLRLPGSSILRFKSVSKQWRSLLSQRNFTQRYYKLSKSPGCFVGNVYVPFDVENGGAPFPSLDFHIDPCGINIVQSCNGLLLCHSDTLNIANRTFYIVNPTTKQIATIPPVPGGYHVRESIVFMGLAFHQTESVHYKLICIRCVNPGVVSCLQIQTYSSDTGKWKISVKSFYLDMDYFVHGVYWNGAMHWCPFWGFNCFYFKIDEEQLQKLPLPLEMTVKETVTQYFGESRGHLHLIVYTSSDWAILPLKDSLHMNVYEMLSDHSGWFVKYQVRLDGLPSAFPEITTSFGYDFSISDVVRGEKEEDTFMVLSLPMVLSHPTKILTFNIHDKSFKNIFNITNFSKLEVYRYTETLASL